MIHSKRNAKIVATFGPASQSEERIKALLQAGVNVARLNFSHGTHASHKRLYQRLRNIAESLDIPLTIIQDLQGPKIRVGELTNGHLTLKPGEKIKIAPGENQLSSEIIPIRFNRIASLLKPGERILLDDGQIELEVVESKEQSVNAIVILGGVLNSHKGVNLPGVAIPLPSVTDKDEQDLRFGLSLGFDAIAISFVRKPEDILFVKELISRVDPSKIGIPVIAKLERPEALENLSEIVKLSDGVMVARGDLGIEMSPQRVPIAQKEIIEIANQHMKVVITATQMLDSMIHNPRPTRAESSDVANAIFDGTDAVMLSGETASGAYPVEAVEMMHSIVCQAEEHLKEWGHWRGDILPIDEHDDTYYMAHAARELAHDRNVAAIAAFTMSGKTAKYVSKVRPSVPILAFTPNEATYRQLNLYWGVEPHLIPAVHTIEEMIAAVEKEMYASGIVEPGQQVILICGFPIQASGPTNLALLHTVGSLPG